LEWIGKIEEMIEVTGNEEEDVGSYWINLSKQEEEDAGN
jgi:hypothetical protein